MSVEIRTSAYWIMNKSFFTDNLFINCVLNTGTGGVETQ
jgi:hypothetical protein